MEYIYQISIEKQHWKDQQWPENNGKREESVGLWDRSQSPLHKPCSVDSTLEAYRCST